MVESQQAGNGGLHSPEVMEAAPAEAALVPAGGDPKRGRVGRWWKRVVETGTQGSAGLAFPSLERLRELEEQQRQFSEEFEKRLQESEGRALEHLETRLEALEAERNESLARALEEGFAQQRSRSRVVGGMAAVALGTGVAALLLALGWIPH